MGWGRDYREQDMGCSAKPRATGKTYRECVCIIIIIIIEGLSLLQCIPPTTADKQTQAQKSVCIYIPYMII